MKACFLGLLLGACLLRGQTGQEPSRREWPCVAGRAVDPAYLETSESSGGQLFLFQRNEIGRAGIFLTADSTHPATLLRAVGNLSGSREFEFAVDSTVRSLLIMANVQCLGSIRVFRPAGPEVTSATAAQSVELQAGRAVRIDLPEPGRWRVRLEGTGLFIAAVRATSSVRISRVEFSEPGGASRREPFSGVTQQTTVHVSGELANPKFQLVTAEGEAIEALDGIETASGVLTFSFQPKLERFRIRMTGTDPSGWPVERVYPVLFRAQAGK